MAVIDDLDTRELRQLHNAIRQALMSMGGRRLPGKRDDHGRAREKVRHSCLFHDDPEPSADYYADDGWYYCHGCGQTFPLQDVVRALQQLQCLELDGLDFLEKKNARRERSGREPEARSPHHHNRFGEPDVVYTYRHTNGRVSHYRLRWLRWNEDGTPELDENGRQLKHLRTQGADYAWKDVATTWPIYGDTTLWSGLNIIVCEGEKAVNAINARGELYQDTLIVAVTCGSATSLLQHGRRLADRLAQLAPARVLLWPDNDKRQETRRWIAPLQRALEAHGVTVGRVDLAPLNLPPKAGPDDYFADGGQLADVFGSTFTPAGAPTLDQLIRDTVVTSDGRFLMPGTRRLYEMKPEHLEGLWYRHTGGQVPRPAALKLLRAALMNRAADSRTEVAYRSWAGPDCVYWRAHPTGHCYRISEEGVRTAYDPPDTLLMVGECPRFSCEIDEGGAMEDLEELCARFGLDGDQAVLVLGWLVCACMGLQTPIMVLRGESGSGKTTLASVLMAVLEPCVPYTDLASDSRMAFDQRQLVNTLKMNSGVILDNVTKFSGEAEDMLSRLVTGYGAHQRILHTDQIEALHMRRAVIVTTIHWDVRKGDLATRLLPLHLEDRGEYIPDRLVPQVFNPYIEKIRGLVFQAVVEFFNQSRNVPPSTSIRIADLGFVLAALGYDGPRIASRLFQMRSDVLNETDFWLGAVVDFYRSYYGEQRPTVGDHFLVSALDIVTHMVNLGCEDVPSHRSPAFARWLREKNPQFKDSGFVVDYVKTVAFRGWRFRTIRATDWE